MDDGFEKLVQEQLVCFGKRLRELRKKKGFSNLDHFAFYVGVNRNSVASWEKGGNITFENLVKVLKVLEMTYDEFFSEGFGKLGQQESEKRSGAGQS